MSIVTDHENGFSAENLELIEAVRSPLAAVMEPIAARRSLSSLLKTYLGSGPSGSVIEGSIHQGDVTRIQAAIMMTDMRDFTSKSIDWTEDELLAALGTYFELIVRAVHENGGDVLKFIGDGVLSVFPVTNEKTAEVQALQAIRASQDARKALNSLGSEEIGYPGAFEFGTGIHFGEVIYGNVGSPDRLDFTVIGQAVNLASRIEGLTKQTGHPILCSQAIADLAPDQCTEIGENDIRGLDEKIRLFSVTQKERH